MAPREILPEKGHALILQTLPTLLADHPNLRLLLAGDGPERKRLESLARTLGDL
ncbi:glycosyltransferase [Gimesia maris]|uniref:glycosyltransferase n=1 Tax=Gimesia maris TaxID=122 RepID=UPI003A920A0D